MVKNYPLWTILGQVFSDSTVVSFVQMVKFYTAVIKACVWICILAFWNLKF